jgi:hypothetical protein
MQVPFTQYLMPDGRQRATSIDMPDDVGMLANELIEKGCRLDIEVLSTGLISMTCEKDDRVLSIEVCPNDENVPKGVEKIIKEANRKLL